MSHCVYNIFMYYFTSLSGAAKWRESYHTSEMIPGKVRSIKFGCFVRVCVVLYLRLLRELKGVDAVSEVGSECVVQLAQRLLQCLERLFVLLQCLKLLLKTDLSVHRLQDIKSWDCMFHSQGFQHSGIPD